ncbi:MAG: aldo/keto reductase [Desulfovermiculus sp.]|nr:aldo/keto reductase [Desulfovermiculus sp.]
MEYTRILGIEEEVSRVALGTWAIGGWMWGGTDEAESIRTIHAALDQGINIVDTAPVYGFGRSEEIVGKALAQDSKRKEVVLATKVALEWDSQAGKVWRNSAPDRIRQEVEDSLRRLQAEVIDIYQVHWPDSKVPFAETANTLEQLKAEGKIRAVGVSNFSVDQMQAFGRGTELAVCQPPYNIFERDIEAEILPYCQKQGIATLTYGALCRGLLTGKMRSDTVFTGDDLRKVDPKFKKPRYEQYLQAVDALQELAKERHGKDIIHLAVRFILDKGGSVALWGGRRPEQMAPLSQVFGWSLSDDDFWAIDRILKELVTDPVGPEFMAPPERNEKKGDRSD